MRTLRRNSARRHAQWGEHQTWLTFYPPEGEDQPAVGFAALAGLDSAREQRRFARAQRHNLLCVAAAPDGRRGSLQVLSAALVYSGVLDPGHHLIHDLGPASRSLNKENPWRA